MTPSTLHPDTARVLDADAGRLALTNDEAENVAIVADHLAAKHGGGFLAWTHDVLTDIKTGARDRHGRRQFGPIGARP